MAEGTFTMRFIRSFRKDGSEAWVGNTVEWPGVVVEADTKDKAREELVAVVGHISRTVHDKEPVFVDSIGSGDAEQEARWWLQRDGRETKKRAREARLIILDLLDALAVERARADAASDPKHQRKDVS